MKIASHPKILAAFALAAGFSATAGAVTLNYNFDSGLSGFTETSLVAGTHYSSTVASGLGGSAGVQFLTGGFPDSLNLTATTFDWSTPITVSIKFKDVAAQTGTQIYAMVGLASSASSSISTATNTEIAVRFRGSDSAVTLQGRVANATFGQSGTISLTNTDWYQLTATFTKSATPNTISYTAEVFNLGATGAGAPTSVASISSTNASVAASLYNSTAITVGFLSSLTSANVVLDDFSVTGTAPIPEPSAFAAIAGLGALGLAASRRRSRRG